MTDQPPACGTALLQVRNLSLDYKGVVALSDVSCEVREGEVVALVGANGAGKTSLLSAIAGLQKPSAGDVLFGGKKLNGQEPHEIAGAGISLVPEGRRLFGNLSVQQNLSLGAYLRHDTDGIEESRLSVIGLFPFLESRLGQRAGTLSGGEQQMVALGRALMSKPRLLMLDEPSLGVAPVMVKRMFDALDVVRASGLSILLVEQNLRMALKFASRGYVLQTGKVVLDGPSAELLDSDDVRRAYLGVS